LTLLSGFYTIFRARWNLQDYTLDTVIGSLTGLVLNGISADRRAEFPAQ
jgi:hypothetical protein